MDRRTHGTARQLVEQFLKDTLEDLPEEVVGVMAFVAWDEDGKSALSKAQAGGVINFGTFRRCFTCWEDKFKQIAEKNGWLARPEPTPRPESVEAAASLICSLFADVAKYTPEEFSQRLFLGLKALATAIGHPLKDMLSAKPESEAGEPVQ